MAEKPPAKHRNTGDDRNLIDAEASESGFDLETWVITFWLTNRKTIFTAIVLALVIVVGLQSYRIISAKIEASTRRAFAEATTEEAMKAFAESHKGHALSGAAYIAKEGALKRKEPVTLVGFGTFKVGNRKARIGRNPRTGQEIRIKAKRVPKFVPGKTLKEVV